jgi:phage gp36-like protein
MAWLTLTSAMLEELMAGPEFSSVTTAAKAAGQDAAEMVANALARVTQEARGYIGSRYALGPDGTVPDEVQGACLAIARVDVLTRIPGLKYLLTKERTEAAKEGRWLFGRIGKGSFAIVESDAPAADQPAAPIIGVIKTRIPRYSRESLDRLY